MPTSDPTEILLIHNRWATQNFLEICKTLSHDDFHHSFEIGLGSLHDSLTHILGAMRGWGDLLAGRDHRPRLEGSPRTPDELLTLLTVIADDLQESVKSHPHDELVTGSRGGKEYTFARGAVLAHVMTHGMHHQAQCLNMFRQLGVEPLPPSAVVEWVLMADAD